MIERDFDVPFIANLALREKQIQQNYRPVIAVHKWFARRPGTLFRGLLLSEFSTPPLSRSFYRSHDLHQFNVADPFMGGGTPVIEANRVGCGVVGYDINPMAYWVVKQETASLDPATYRDAAGNLMRSLSKRLGPLYTTTCLECGSDTAPVKYFLWIKVQDCRKCGKEFPLFPGYQVAANSRHPRHVLLCAGCGALNELEDPTHPGRCTDCKAPLSVKGSARAGNCSCPHCGTDNRYPDPNAGPPRHRMFAIEYFCQNCRDRHQGRFFKKPEPDDLAKYNRACRSWRRLRPTYVPEDLIRPGDETNRLLRWGYRRYREMFNERQLLGLELSCRTVEAVPEGPVRDALRTNLSDLLRYQNMLCRYDTMALKSLDIFSVHGFPVGLIQCESGLLGIRDARKGTAVGSGGWVNVVDKYARAKEYCNRPFEYLHQNGRKTRVELPGEWVGTTRTLSGRTETRRLELRCEDASTATLRPGTLDAILTDPPYFANVQYAELMDFCYVWLRRLVGPGAEGFAKETTRDPQELTGNVNMGRNLHSFTDGLTAVFGRMAQALKPGKPLAFTYHHNRLEAYLPVGVALLDAGLVCSASLPSPAEMGASIHINGTGSSIVDTVFVCRTTGRVPQAWLVDSPKALAELLARDVGQLRSGGVRVTDGDTHCIALGHLLRLAVWNLRRDWKPDAPTPVKLQAVARWVANFGGVEAVIAELNASTALASQELPVMVGEGDEHDDTWNATVPF